MVFWLASNGADWGELLIFQLEKRREFEIGSKNKAWPPNDRGLIDFN